MEDIQITVDQILDANSNKDKNKFRTTDVENSELIEIDAGNLLAVSENSLLTKSLKENKEGTLLSNTRDATQVLFNTLWKLPVEQVEGNYLVKLPESTTWLPREKPVPKKRAVTKWEEYAKSKGILNKKKSRMVWDDASQSYKPRWGYKRANDNTQDWLIEVPQNADPFEDQFAKRKVAKRERVAKNELQRLRNIARSQKKKVPGVGLTPTDKPDKDHLSKAMAVARKSDASIGRFTEKLPKEKISKFGGKKRKFEPSIRNLTKEKEMQLKLFETNAKKVPKINVTKAVNKVLREEEEQRAKEKLKTPKKQKGKKGGDGGRKAGKKSRPSGKRGKKR